MNNLRLATAALAVMAAAGLAQAQDSTTAPSTPSMTTECPAKGAVPEAQLPEHCKTATDQGTNQSVDKNNATNPRPAASSETTQSTTPPSTTGTETTTQSATGDTAVLPEGVDSNSSFLASNFIDQKVYSTANESVGDINDLIVNKDNKVMAVVGVGGFLGIGEKDVAMNLDDIKMTKDENGHVRLTIPQSREQLEAAPAFDRTALNLGR